MNESGLVSTEEFERARKYWLEKLSNGVEEIRLQQDFTARHNKGKICIKKAFEKEAADRLAALSKGQDLLLYTILMSIFKVQCYKYTRQKDITVTSPIYTTTGEVYDFNKCILMKDILEDQMTFKELLINVKNTVVEGYINQYYPMEKIMQTLKRSGDFRLHKIILLMRGLHNPGMIEEIVNSTENDITLSFGKNSGELECSIIYNTALFSADTIERFWKSYQYITKQILQNLNSRIRCLELVDEEEKRQLLYQFSGGPDLYQGDLSISKFFEEQVKSTPDNIAVEIGDKSLTYSLLNEEANRTARILVERGVEVGSIVGIAVDYGFEMIIAILAVLKAGGAYLPLDLDYPVKRIAYMLKDSGASVLLTQKSIADRWAAEAFHKEMKIIHIDEEAVLNGKETGNPDKMSSANDLAYIVYTSGTSGHPKGVMVENKGVINTIQWRIKKYGITSGDKILQLLSVSFDGFGTNLYSSLLAGAALVLPDRSGFRDFKHIAGVIKSKGITNVSLVPVMYRAILENTAKGDLETLKTVILAGEKSSSGLIRLSAEKAPKTLLINEYGPTENSIVTTSLLGMSHENPYIIGKPIANNKVFILDKNLGLVPVGVPGELCISGVGLARGYINNEEMTEEKFVWNPYLKSERMYKTGDIVRWLPDGNIEYIGRKGGQVKVRGYRVELGEVENSIKNTGRIKEVAVTCKEGADGTAYLCAFIVPDENLNITEMRELLRTELPIYMIPSKFVSLDRLPVGSNGKVDKAALPDPDQCIGFEEEYVKPEGRIEAEISEIWSSVLKQDAIGTNHNFFSIGGNSILIMQVHSRLEQLYPGKVTIADLFTYPTISRLANFIGKEEEELSKGAELEYIILPLDYYMEESGNSGPESFTYELPDFLLQKARVIACNENIEIDDILLSTYIYLLAGINNQERVIVQTADENRNRLVPVSAEVHSIKRLEELFRLVRQQRKDCNCFTDISGGYWDINRNKDKLSVLPLYCTGNMPANIIDLKEAFDIIVGIEQQGERIYFTIEYNCKRLRHDKMKKLAGAYMKLLNQITAICEPAAQ